MSSAFAPAQGTSEVKQPHSLIDEAQDLSIPEVSMLASPAYRMGVLMISADFSHIISAVHGMTDLSRLRVGISFSEPDEFAKFPLARNIQRSREIGKFLEAYYHPRFGELAPFQTGERISDCKPKLLLSRTLAFDLYIKRIWCVLSNRLL